MTAIVPCRTPFRNNVCAATGTTARRCGKSYAAAMLLVALLCVSPAALAQSGTPQLKVVDTIWGFDGRVQPGQFNPLSILLDNQTPDTIDGTLTLQEMQGALSVSGGQHVMPVYMEPAGRRWVQFYPYVSTPYQTDWQLTYRSRDGQVNKGLGQITQARSAVRLESDGDDVQAQPQFIILDEAGSVSRRPPTVKHFQENNFPPYVSATVGLHTVFLDHDPDWEQPREQSFLSWLKLGGRLHLLQDSRGEFPQLSGDLAELNQPLNRFAVGNGVVVRHSLRRDALSEQLIRSSVVVDALKAEDEEQKTSGQGLEQLMEVDAVTIDSELFRQMRELTLPEHSWGLIFLLALCYIGLIFPGCYLVSKQKHLHFLTTYGAIIGLSLIFSVLFLIIGRRGYGESTTVHTIAVARAEDDTHWDVMQWNAFFVTSGDDYTASATDQQVVFSIADNTDRIDAQVVPGNNGEARMRIPPYSALTFLSRRRVSSSNDWKLNIAEADIQETGIRTLKINVGDGFPVSPETHYSVIAGRSLYEMKYAPQQKQLSLFGGKKSIANYCQPDYDYGYNFGRGWGSNNSNETRSPHQVFYDAALPSLVQRSLLDDLVHRPVLFELPRDRIRLLVYTEIPEEFEINVSAPASRQGRVLLTKDLYLQGNP
ncbi:MAG: hypothetical protein R3C59_01980 [Planctomycetaceae bacterium]